MPFFFLYFADSFKQDANSASLNSLNLSVPLMTFDIFCLPGNLGHIHLSIMAQIFMGLYYMADPGLGNWSIVTVRRDTASVTTNLNSLE